MELELVSSIVNLLQKEFSSFALPTRGESQEIDGPRRQLNFFEGYLPSKEDFKDDVYPFVLVKADSAETDGQKTQVAVSFVVGTYGKESCGYKDAMNVMNKIRQCLLPCSQSCLNGCFNMLLPVSWSITEEQPWPYWQLKMATQWVIYDPSYIPAGLPNVSSNYAKQIERALYG